MTLLVGLQEGHLACKKLSGGAGVVVCLGRGADLHMAQLTPLPLTASFLSKIQIGFTFLVPARLTRLLTDKGSLNGCVCVCVSQFPLGSSFSISSRREPLRLMEQVSTGCYVSLLTPNYQCQSPRGNTEAPVAWLHPFLAIT